MNITANILGLGNAATPLGIAAMKEMNKLNKNSGIATNSMITFVVSFLQEKKYMVRDMLYKSPVWIRWIIYWLILGIILFANTNKKSMGGFIYANF